MAEGVNKVILVGNLGKDPDLGYTPNGTARCRITVATSESYMGNNNERQEKTEWHNVLIWGKQGESVGKYLSKGRQVYIEGKLQTSSWDDEKSGQKRYKTEVVAQRVIFLGGKGEGSANAGGGGAGGGSGGGGGYSGGSGGGGSAGGSGGSGDQSRFNDPGPAMSDDDIPF